MGTPILQGASATKQSLDSEPIIWRLLRHFVPRNDIFIVSLTFCLPR